MGIVYWCSDLFFEYICGHIDGVSHRGLAGLSFTGDWEAGAMVRRGSDEGKPCSEIYARIEGHVLERDQALIMVHG